MQTRSARYVRGMIENGERVRTVNWLEKLRISQTSVAQYNGNANGGPASVGA